MCRSKKHEVREANMYFFVEATIALSVILSEVLCAGARINK
jgi:hypothetical protein